MIHRPVLFEINAVLEQYGVTCWEWCGEDKEGGVPMYNPMVMGISAPLAEHLGGMMPSSMSKLTRMSMVASSSSAGNTTTANINDNKHGDRCVTPWNIGKDRVDERC